MQISDPTPAGYPALNERTQHLLKFLVERYIRDGHPVGSRTLSRDAGLDLSSATVRNVMADLEELGYLRAPHTSAGRVPTARGYRFFIDTLLRVKPLDPREIEALRRRIDQPAQSGTELARSVSDLLSGLTRLAGIVMLPRRQTMTLRQVEFLPLSECRVLAILVLNGQEVQNRIIQTRRAYDAAELQRAANYLNAQFGGRDIQQVRKTLLDELRETRDSLDRLMQTVMEMAEQTFETAPEGGDYVVAGQTHLMQYADLSDLDKLRQLFEAFNQKSDLLHLFDQCLHTGGVQIFVGEESGCGVLEGCSVVTAPYGSGDQVLGVLGIIGPTRMAYDRVIPVVDVTARLLAEVLDGQRD
ncbi:MAG: heat-inducible transcriptional repressor HrcA [Candidatus Competibacteraceae bacterium]|nr:MAG: heat-inducible transcriptional repressor HrcA [Candidatus Competibacteraceae bacterium]